MSLWSCEHWGPVPAAPSRGGELQDRKGCGVQLGRSDQSLRADSSDREVQRLAKLSAELPLSAPRTLLASLLLVH